MAKASKNNQNKLAEILKDLNKPRGEGKRAGFKYRLHDKQTECLMALFRDKKDTVFAACGRKFGKTELAAYALYRQCLTVPNSACYYVAPEKTHARDLIWKNNRLQKFLEGDSEKYIAKIQDREMTIRFTNGSFITMMGSDNWKAANGLTPHLVVYDEYKAFKPQFHVEMEPNRGAKGAPLLIIGTQPKVGDANKDQYEQEMNYARESNDSSVFEFTSFDNPINLIEDSPQRQTILKHISKLKATGQEDVIQREYYSKIVPGGSNAIFPMFNEDLHVDDPMTLRKELEKERDKLQWIVACDPATSSTFAVVLVAIHKHTKHVYIVDEIYEKAQSEISVSQIWPRIQAMVNKHCLQDRYSVQYVSDEREGLFIAEVRAQFKQQVFPTQKHLYKKHNGITLIRDLMLFEMLHVSSSCQNMLKEILEYSRDSKGNIAKINDHAIDCIAGYEKVSTTRGDIPIKNVKIGDRVYTNKGIDIVTDHWSKGEVKVIRLHFTDGSRLDCTPDHRIYTKNRGFVKSLSLTENDTLCILNEWKKKKYYIMESFLGDTPTLITSQTLSILNVVRCTIKRALGICIGTSMRQKLAQYPRGIMSTTKTITTSITTSITSKLSALKNICQIDIQGIAPKKQESTLAKSDTLLKNGMLLKKVKSGTQKILKKCGKICQKLLKSVFCAEKNTKCTKTWLKSLNIVTPTVRLSGIEELGKVKVYDLTTKNYSRFYVNGKLVHNCLRYSLGQANYTVAIPDNTKRKREVLPGVHEEVESDNTSKKELEDAMSIGSSFDWDW